jgi:hypothetical protein
MSDLNLEVKDAAQIEELGRANDDIMAAQMEILAREFDSDNGEDTMEDDLEEESSSGGRWTHNPRTPDYKIGAQLAYISQGGNYMHLGSVISVHQDGEGGPPFYTMNL